MSDRLRYSSSVIKCYVVEEQFNFYGIFDKYPPKNLQYIFLYIKKEMYSEIYNSYIFSINERSARNIMFVALLT